MDSEFQTIRLAIVILGLLLSAGNAVLAQIRNFRSIAYRAFSIGMVCLIAETILLLLSVEAASPIQAVAFGKWRLTCVAFIPGFWLIFSLSYARGNYAEFLKAWRGIVLGAFAIPILLVSVARNELFIDGRVAIWQGNWIMPLGWSGYLLYICQLLIAVLILVNLEKTIVTSYGKIRWQIKFSVLAIGILFIARLYTSIQVLLFSTLNTQILSVNSSILVITNILLIVSSIRNRWRNSDIYVSQQILQNSVTFLVIGLYLIGLGIAVKVSVYLNISKVFFEHDFIYLVGLLGSLVLLFSEKVRYNIKRSVHIHFKRPFHDYRRIWTEFTQNTASKADIKQLSSAIARSVSEVFTCSEVSIWLFDDHLPHPFLAGSTAFSLSDARIKTIESELALLTGKMRLRKEPICLREFEWDVPAEVVERLFEVAAIQYCAPLSSAGEVIGMLTMNNPNGGPLSFEDSDLFRTIADQAAILILNLKLFEGLGHAREMQAFQSLSAFFVHDLKNVASTLSLTLENFPVHYDNAEFRADALKMISHSLEKIRNMCSKLSEADFELRLERQDTDLNEIVLSVIAKLSANGIISTNLGALPKANLDPEQIQKVVLNLILNSIESIEKEGKILIETYLSDNNIVFSIQDNGCGMSTEFIGTCLFQPFRTTKKKGLGVGMYHTKTIVEAHYGKIEVQSEEGKGTRFRILLPL